MQRGDSDALGGKPGGPDQHGSGPGRRHPGQRDHHGHPPQPRAAGPGGQAQQAERYHGDPGQEHHPGDRQVRQVGIEDPGDRLVVAVGVGRQDQRPPTGVTEPVLIRHDRRQEGAERGDRRGEPAGEESADREPRGAERSHGHGADRHPPPRRRALQALVGVDGKHDDHEDQVGAYRPDRGRGPGGELGRPARPDGAGHQVGGAAPAVSRPHPGGHAGHERREIHEGPPLPHVPERALHPEGRHAPAEPVGVEPEQRGDHRQDPRHRAAAQFYPQQPGRRQRNRAPRARRPVPHRGVGRGGHDRTAVADRAAPSTAL